MTPAWADLKYQPGTPSINSIAVGAKVFYILHCNVVMNFLSYQYLVPLRSINSSYHRLDCYGLSSCLLVFNFPVRDCAVFKL